MLEMIGSHGKTILLQEATWESQIKSARVILSALLKQHDTSLNDESRITLLAEVESIVSLRPLTVKTLSDTVVIMTIMILKLKLHSVQSTYSP